MKPAKCYYIRCQGTGRFPEVYMEYPPTEAIERAHNIDQLDFGRPLDDEDLWVRVETGVLFVPDDAIGFFEPPDPLPEDLVSESELRVESSGAGTVTDPQQFPDPENPPKQPDPPTQEEMDRMSNPPSGGHDWYAEINN